jgi:hypothetical protein
MIILVIGTNMYFLNNLSALDSERLIPGNVARKDRRRGIDSLNGLPLICNTCDSQFQCVQWCPTIAPRTKEKIPMKAQQGYTGKLLGVVILNIKDFPS